MKKNLIVCSCFVALMACSSSTEKTETSTAATNQQEEARQTGVQTSIDTNATVAVAGDGGTLENNTAQPAATPATEPVSPPLKEAEPAAAITKATSPDPKLSGTPAAAKQAAEAKTAPPTEAAQDQTKTIIISVVPDLMQFDKEQITVKAGQKVIIELENPDGMQHNLVIIKPGTIDKVGAAADALARDPKGAQQHYVPKMPEVLFATKLLNPEEVVTLSFTAPTQPGDYPFVCTFPGHWRMMQGVMKVTK